MLNPNPQLPHASARVPLWVEARASAGRLLVALDFDGTLAPIVERPEDARIPAACADALARLAGRADTIVAVISGRGLEDVRARVGLEGVYYAGNHGMEIGGPELERTLPEAASARSGLEACRDELERALGSVPGLLIEDKGLTLSVHYRRVAADAQADVRRRALEACAGRDGMRLTEGKKIVEVRPDVDWHKGRALEFLLNTLADDRPLPVIFVGDDVTDEDGFRAIRDRGDGVLVAEDAPHETAATAWLRSPAEVSDALDRLARDE